MVGRRVYCIPEMSRVSRTFFFKNMSLAYFDLEQSADFENESQQIVVFDLNLTVMFHLGIFTRKVHEELKNQYFSSLII